MTVTRETLRQAAAMRVEVSKTVDKATRDLVQAWSGAWAEVADEWSTALDELTAAGEWPTRTQVFRAKRAQRALNATVEALEGLASTSGVRIIQDVPVMSALGMVWAEQLVASQWPKGEALDWAAVDPKALSSIVKRTTQQIEKATRRLPHDQSAVMKQVLVRGIAVGDNPRRAAALMLDRLGGVFDGGRRRAETIARTEMLDAHRAAALAARKENANVLAGWEWQATLDVRTCPACLSMHGRIFPVDAAGPQGHQNCRCASLPVVKSWRELGFDMDDPKSDMPDAEEWFNSQPDKVQAAIMGPERLRRLRSGDLLWDDLAVRRDNPGWRPSYVVRPLEA